MIFSVKTVTRHYAAQGEVIEVVSGVKTMQQLNHDSPTLSRQVGSLRKPA